MCCVPLIILLESFARRDAVPGVAVAALQRYLGYLVVDALVAIAKEWAVGADLIVASPDEAGTGCWDEIASAGSGLPGCGPDSYFFEPCDACVDPGDLRGGRVGQRHQE